MYLVYDNNMAMCLVSDNNMAMCLVSDNNMAMYFQEHFPSWPPSECSGEALPRSSFGLSEEAPKPKICRIKMSEFGMEIQAGT